jgi:predicted aspartyl protease
MKFPYSTVILAASDNGHFFAFRRPEIPVWISGRAGRAEVVGLVDTGSDKTIFPGRSAMRCKSR